MPCGPSQVVHASTLEGVSDIASQPTVIAVAAIYGKVRLIDNLELRS